LTWYSINEALNRIKVRDGLIKSIVNGYDEVVQFICSLAMQEKKKRKRPCIFSFDGFTGVNWESIIKDVKKSLGAQNINVEFIQISSCLKAPLEIEKMVKHCLTNDSYFGYVYEGKLDDFFRLSNVRELRRKFIKYRTQKTSVSLPDIIICYGDGSVLPLLRDCYDKVFYVDITRETFVRRVEEENILPIGSKKGDISSRLRDKRFNYVDLQVLKLHKRYVLKCIDYYIENNSSENLILLPRQTYEQILGIIAQYPFRLKPVYMPGVWGGQEMKRIRGLPKSMINCSFALEVIPHLQGIRIAIGDTQIEVPFYNLLWAEPVKVMSKNGFKKFKGYFPITLNYDDTVQGGNLAIQNHPNGTYLRRCFNERMRRDESYYVVKTYPGAKTYHGLKEGTDLDELRKLAIRAEKEGIPFDYDQYIDSIKSKEGDLFLIPAGTVHASGANQLVLEIDTDPSKTSAEYTFHLYDYLRPNLDGSMRGIHIKHYLNVLKSYRKTNWVTAHLRQSQRVIRKGKGWAEYLIGKLREMYYEIHRLEFTKKIEDNTSGKFHILTLVVGESVIIKSQKYPERQCKLSFTETIIIPACLGKYIVINRGKKPCKMTKALLK